MTAQIQDCLILREKKYIISELRGGSLLSPLNFGMNPIGFSTVCHRGFYCHYTCDEEGLFLTTMALREQDERYALLGGRSPVSDGLGAFVYQGLREFVPFSGRMLIVGDRIEGMSNIMGAPIPISYQTVLQLIFGGGELLNEIDHSAEVNAIRVKSTSRMAMYEAITPWIERVMSAPFSTLPGQ